MIGTSLRRLKRLMACLTGFGDPDPKVANHRGPTWFRSRTENAEIKEAGSADARRPPGWTERLTERLLLTPRLESALGLDEADDTIEPLAFLQIGHNERPVAAHPSRIKVHLLE